jgi:hypothetical protein
MTGLRLLVRSARSMLRSRPRGEMRSALGFLPTRVWWVPQDRRLAVELVLIIEAQERLRAHQPRG